MKKAKEDKEAKKKKNDAKLPPSIGCFGMQGITIKNRGGLEDIVNREMKKELE